MYLCCDGPIVQYDEHTLTGRYTWKCAGWMPNDGSDEWEFRPRGKVYPEIGQPFTKDILEAFEDYCDANGITYA